MKTIKLIIVALIFFAAGFFLGKSWQWPNTYINTLPEASIQKNSVITYSLQFSDSERTEFNDVPLTDNETVLAVLQKLAQENNITIEIKQFSDLGSMVDKIGDKVNGQDNKYWQYTVNGEYAPVGADQYKLKPNDAVEWKFTADQFKQ